jgi:hypothetical protein
MTQLRRNFGGEVFLLFLDPLAQGVTREAG